MGVIAAGNEKGRLEAGGTGTSTGRFVYREIVSEKVTLVNGFCGLYRRPRFSRFGNLEGTVRCTRPASLIRDCSDSGHVSRRRLLASIFCGAAPRSDVGDMRRGG